jgi:hypothetical protein
MYFLSCPHCKARLVHVPCDGLILYYCCLEHGLVILQPLVPIDDDLSAGDSAVPEESGPHAMQLSA